jgi:hypothetical protein
VPQDTARRSGRARTALLWLLANAAIGYFMIFPLTAAVLLGDEEEAAATVVLLVGGLLVLVPLAVLVNRALLRRLTLRGWPAVAFWVATAAFVLAPFVLLLVKPDLSPALM